MTGFGKGHSGQTILTDFVETCEKHQDDTLYTGAVVTDLPKAFD